MMIPAIMVFWVYRHDQSVRALPLLKKGVLGTANLTGT
jgi:hypothetical protein